MELGADASVNSLVSTFGWPVLMDEKQPYTMVTCEQAIGLVERYV